MARIVTLIPSATEIVCALGLGEELVGRSHECDHPTWVSRLPACTSAKLPGEGTSAEIDERVKAILSDGLSVYRVDAERLRTLRPSVIVTQTQCEVCAASLADVERAVCEWLGERPRLVSLEPSSLDDVWRDVGTVAAALGAPARGDSLLALLRGRLEETASRAAAVAGARPPTVAAIEWIDPLMAAGNWMPELIKRAGGRSLLGEAGERSSWMTLEDLEQADPDWIVIVPCGFGLERTRREARVLQERASWHGLRAVREGRVVLADGNQYFNRPGPRLVESLEILCEIFHPGAFAFGHEGEGWARMEF